nr:MAG TPA: hypothetical protein [Caudoviricetes sp.]
MHQAVFDRSILGSFLHQNRIRFVHIHILKKSLPQRYLVSTTSSMALYFNLISTQI